MTNSFPISTQVKVYFSDCDMMGHLNNARFFTFMEQARLEYAKNFSEIDFRNLKSDPVLSFILAEISCNFKSPAYLDETLIVKIRASDLKRSSFVFEYELSEEKTKRLVALGRSVQVFFNYQQQKSVEIPEGIRKKFEEIEGQKW
jgi:acyl-CoA thioester hydrolase